MTPTLALLTRFWWEYKQVWKGLVVRDVLDRILFLFAFGYGMGAIVKQMGDVSYLAFLAPGIACSSPMMTMTMATTFGAYERFNSSGLWQSWLATPVRLPHILMAELLYANLRSLPSVFILLLLAWLLDALPNPAGVIYAIPVILLANMAYGSVALCFTTFVTRHLYFSYVNTLWMMPMYLFSGVFFDLTKTPDWLQAIANLYPLTHVLKIVRPLLLGQPLAVGTTLLSLAALLFIFLAAFMFAQWRFKKRLLR
jgi:lipooligosaccharide transport system permease protein